MAAPTPLATVPDLSGWLGETIAPGDDTLRAGWALRMASALVRAEVGLTWLDEDGELDGVPEQATLVTLAVAARAHTSPDDQVVQETVDDYTYREAERLEPGVSLTASEKALLGKLAESYRGGIGTISTERGDLRPMNLCGEEERLLPPYY